MSLQTALTIQSGVLTNITKNAGDTLLVGRGIQGDDGGALTITPGSGQSLTLNGTGLSLAPGSGELDITGTGLLDINTAGMDVDLTSDFTVDVVGGGFSLDADANSNVTLAGSDAGWLTLTLAAQNAGEGSSKLALQADAIELGEDSNDNIAFAGRVNSGIIFSGSRTVKPATAADGAGNSLTVAGGAGSNGGIGGNLVLNAGAGEGAGAHGIVQLGLASTSGVSFGADASFADNIHQKFGTGLDLDIYHDGTDSNISNSGGNLKLYNVTASASDTMLDIRATNSGDGAGQVSITADSTTITGGSLVFTGSAMDLDPTGAFSLDMDAGQAVTITLDDMANAMVIQAAGGEDLIALSYSAGSKDISLGNATDNPTLQQLGTGDVTFNGNVNAVAGLDVTGGNFTAAGGVIELNPTGNFTLDMDATKVATVTLADTQDAALLIQDASVGAYLEIETGASGDGNIKFGSAATNPGFAFLGSGILSHGGLANFSGHVTLGSDSADEITIHGLVQSDLTFGGIAKVISHATAAADAAGVALDIYSGQGGAASAVGGGAGGVLTIKAAAGGAGDDTLSAGNGGNIVLDAGPAGADGGGGAGFNGTVSLGATNASAVTIGRTGITTTVAGDLSVSGTETVVGITTFQDNVQFGDAADDEINFVGVVSSGITFKGGADRAIALDTGSLSLSTTTSGTIALDSVGLVDINAGANLDVDVTGTIDLLASGAFSIDGTGASNVTATEGNLTLSTATSGTLILTGAALVDLNAGANLDIDVTGTFDMLSTGAISIDGTGDSNFSIDTGTLTISTTTSGDVTLAPVDSLNLPQFVKFNDSGSGYVATTSTTLAADLNTLTDGSNADALHSHAAGGTLSRTAGENLGAGAPVCLHNGNSFLTDADDYSSNGGKCVWAFGISPSAVTSGNSGDIQVAGEVSIPDAIWDAVPTATQDNLPAYLSTSKGKLTITAPSTAGQRRLRIGFVSVGGSGAVRLAISIGEPADL